VDGAERDAVIVAHLDWCRATVRLFIRRSNLLIPFDDANAVARLALVEAAGRYRPGGPATFQTFARRRVTGAVLDMAHAASGAHRPGSANLRSTKRVYRAAPVPLDLLARELVDSRPSALDVLSDRQLVERLLTHATAREREVLTAYWLEDLSLAEIGARMGCLESRACQLAKSGVARIRAKWR
jgi:RNA polymerase sigma factor (sigma-70 family)